MDERVVGGRRIWDGGKRKLGGGGGGIQRERRKRRGKKEVTGASQMLYTDIVLGGSTLLPHKRCSS